MMMRCALEVLAEIQVASYNLLAQSYGPFLARGVKRINADN